VPGGDEMQEAGTIEGLIQPLGLPFDLRLARRQPRWIDAGIGSGTAERLQGAVQWGHRNIGARGMQGVLEGRLALDADGKFQRARISGSLAEPWLFATRTRGLVTLYLEEQHDRSDPRVLLETESKGVTFELRRQLGRYTRLALIQDNAFVIQAYTFRDPNLDPALRDSLIADVIPSYKTHRLALALSRDSRDDLIRMVTGTKPGTSVPMTLIREKKEKTVTINTPTAASPSVRVSDGQMAESRNRSGRPMAM